MVSPLLLSLLVSRNVQGGGDGKLRIAAPCTTRSEDQSRSVVIGPSQLTQHRLQTTQFLIDTCRKGPFIDDGASSLEIGD